MIRPITQSDLEATFGIIQQTMVYSWSRQTLEGFFKEGNVSIYGIFNPNVEGFAVVNKVGNEGEIYYIAVVPSQQNRGYGGQLLDHLLNEAKKVGMIELFLEVSTENGKAVGLYTSRGFEKVGRRKDYYRASKTSFCDAYIMRKKLRLND